jgi:dTDP-4-dehydrorhamnose 3,5-epimerase-like enzyme
MRKVSLKIEIKRQEIFRDERGWLAEILKGEEVGPDFGQIYITVAHPNKIKGNHYHAEKTEWICVIKGKAKISFVDIDNGMRKHIFVNDEELLTIKVPPKIAHGFKNIGDEMLYILIYTNKVYDPTDTDTFEEEVII